MSDLYILQEDGNAHPVSASAYSEWEDMLNDNERCCLGKRLKADTVNGTNIITMFLGTPVGHFGRRPQLWVTLALGDGVFSERRYSSHRAALNGHAAECRLNVAEV